MTVLQYTQLSLMASLGPWDTLPRCLQLRARRAYRGCVAERCRAAEEPYCKAAPGAAARLQLSPTALGYNSSLMVASLGMRAAAMGESSLMLSLIHI